MPTRVRPAPNSQAEPFEFGSAVQRARFGGRVANEAEHARFLENYGGSPISEKPPKYDRGAEISEQLARAARRNPNLSTKPVAMGANTPSHLLKRLRQLRQRLIGKAWSDQAREAALAARRAGASGNDGWQSAKHPTEPGVTVHRTTVEGVGRAGIWRKGNDAALGVQHANGRWREASVSGDSLEENKRTAMDMLHGLSRG